METSAELGMQTFDTSLYNLVVEGVVAESEALKYAGSISYLKLRLKYFVVDDGGERPSQESWKLLE